MRKHKRIGLTIGIFSRAPKRGGRYFENPLNDTSPAYNSSSFGDTVEMQDKPFKSTGLPMTSDGYEDPSAGIINPNFGLPPSKDPDDSAVYATLGAGPSRSKPKDSNA